MHSGKVFERKIIRIVQVLLKEDKKQFKIPANFVFDSSKQLWIRLTWSALILLSTIMLTYQSFDRLLHYLDYPIEVDVQIKPVRKVTFPRLTICSEHTEQTDQLMRMGKFEGKSCLYIMLNLLSSKDLNMMDVWKASNTTSLIIKAGIENSLTIPTNKEILTPFGTCASFYSGIKEIPMASCVSSVLAGFISSEVDKMIRSEEFPFRGEEIAFNIDLAKTNGKCRLVLIRLMFQPDDEAMDYINCASFSPGFRRKMGFTFQKYKFANRPNFPCLEDKAVFDSCMDQCKHKLYRKLSCRYPFIPPGVDLPECKTSPRLRKEAHDAYEIFMGFRTNSKDCGCVKEPCEQTFYDLIMAPEDITENASYNSFYFRNGYYTVTSERLVYDSISLLSDLGGNLGLCLGCALLDIVYWFQLLVGLLKGNQKMLNRRRRDPLFKTVHSILKEFQKMKQNAVKRSLLWSYAWKVFVTICTLLALYLLTARIEYYFTYPMKLELHVKNNMTVQYPMVTVCWESTSIAEFLKSVAEKNNLSTRCNLTLYDLMDPPFSKSADQIWNWANTSEDRREMEYMPNQTFKTTALPYGNCLTITTGLVSHAETFHDFLFGRFYKPGVKPECVKDIKVFITPPGDIINPTAYEIVPERTVTGFMFTLKAFIRNTQHDVQAAKDQTACKIKCIEERIKRNVTCSMPFVKNVDHLPRCTTSKAARITESAYLEAFVATRAEVDCACPTPNKYTIYDSRITIAPKGTGTSLLAFVFGNTRVEHYYKVSSFTKSKLVSELGANVSAILGFSLLSLIHIMYTIFENVAQVIKTENVTRKGTHGCSPRFN